MAIANPKTETQTKLADVIEPDLFAQYVIDRTTEKSELMYAGAVESNATLNSLITGGGTIFTMPKWNDLSGSSEVLTERNPISVSNITTKKELATMLIRAKAWGATELSGALAGSDPMQAIGSLVADWWVRDEKKTILSVLNGVFSASSMSGLVSDVTSASTKTIGVNTVLDAKQLMGDASDLLTTLYMHSATYTKLQKDNVISFIPNSQSQIQIPTYLGYRVICDDSCPVIHKFDYELDGVAQTAIEIEASTVAQAEAYLKDKFGTTKSGTTYTTHTITNVALASDDSPKYVTYLLSRGCIQRGNGTPLTLTPVETDRDSLYSTDILINRQAKVLHPRGISWIGSANILDSTPTDAELATGTNWELVSDEKKIGMVKLIHTL